MPKILNALEKAKFVAETNTRRRRSAPTLRQVESQLTKNILAQSLALEIIRNAQLPATKVVEQLMEIETDVGEFVAEVLQKSSPNHSISVDLRGVLAGALSVIPIPAKSFYSRSSLKASMRNFIVDALRKILSEEPVEAKRNVNQLSPIHPHAKLEVRPAKSVAKKPRRKAIGAEKKSNPRRQKHK